MATVTLKNVKKIYPRTEEEKSAKKKGLFSKKNSDNHNDIVERKKNEAAVKDFNLEINDKEFIVLVGPSGCGKSTTLRMIAGLETITEGELYINDKYMNDIDGKDRNIAMVFQNYALYPHMTVAENMGFSLKLKHVPKDEIARKVKEAAEILDIAEFLNRKPKALSGGQRQRVAIGRAIVRDPAIFLMDEPLSNLDAKLRNQMRAELIKLHDKLQATFIYVTHDQTEAMTLGDRIVVMKNGYIQQVGTPKEVFNHPANIFVASFIGSPQMNFFDTNLLKEDGKYFVTIGDEKIELSTEKEKRLKGNSIESQEVILGVRPEHIELSKKGIEATVELSEMMGSSLHLHVDVNGKEIVVVVPISEKDNDSYEIGSKVHITFSGKNAHLFDKTEKNNLEW